MENKEDKNAVIRPTTKGKTLNVENPLKDEIISTIAASDMAGIPNKKENFAASALSQPEIKAVEIVTPDLETPGKIANAWEIPIKILFDREWFFKFIKPFFDLSATYINIPIKIETNAIDKLERSTLSKKLGIKNFTLPPSKTIGIVAIKIDLINLWFNKWLWKLLSDCLLFFKMSFLKYQIRANTLPNWIIADKEGPGSLIPRKKDMIFKWAVLLTGINSVNPWIKPYNTNFKYSN